MIDTIPQRDKGKSKDQSLNLTKIEEDYRDNGAFLLPLGTQVTVYPIFQEKGVPPKPNHWDQHFGGITEPNIVATMGEGTSLPLTWGQLCSELTVDRERGRISCAPTSWEEVEAVKNLNVSRGDFPKPSPSELAEAEEKIRDLRRKNAIEFLRMHELLKPGYEVVDVFLSVDV